MCMSDFFYRNDRLFGDLPILRASAEPCIVCGHPTGDCTAESHNPQDTHISTTENNLDSMKDERLIYVFDTIYGEKQLTPYTTVKVTLAKAGTYVTVAKAKELGIIIN